MKKCTQPAKNTQYNSQRVSELQNPKFNAEIKVLTREGMRNRKAQKFTFFVHISPA